MNANLKEERAVLLLQLPDSTMEEVALPRMLPMSQEPHRHLERKSQIILPTPDLSSVSTTPRALPFWSCPHPQTPPSPGTAVSSLQSKVKALSQSRGAKRGRDCRNPVALVVGPNQTQTVKRGRDKKVSNVLSPAVNDAGGKRSSSSDQEVEPQYQVQTYLTDPLQKLGDEQEEDESSTLSTTGICALPRGPGEGASLENLFDDTCRFQEDEPTSVNPWTPPKGLWKTARCETLLLNGSTHLRDGPSGKPTVGVGHQRNSRLTVEQSCSWEQQQSRDFVTSHPWRHLQKETGCLGYHGGLWRTDSWDSVCSSSSSVSLAERVEINRGILKHMLNKAWHKGIEETSALESEQPSNSHEMQQSNGRGLISLHDSDWDSGISLHGSEHTHSRSLVSGDELPMSPRLQQARLLLERARSKSRRCPLKGDHTILPLQRSCKELGGVALHRTPLPSRESLTLGNLSDSSSGDSTCGPWLRRGTSPTRVRFQDESEKDAEVRYLERQRRRAAERAQDLLSTKPSFHSYTHSTMDCSLMANTSTHNKIEGIHNTGLTKNGDKSQEAGKCHTSGTVVHDLPQLQSNLSSSTERKVLPCWIAPSRPNPVSPTERKQNDSRGTVTFTHELDLGSTEAECVARQKIPKEEDRNDPQLETALHLQPEPGSNGDEVSKICESSDSKLRQGGMEIVRPPTPYFKEQCGGNMRTSSFYSVPSVTSGALTTSSVQLQPKVAPTTPQPIKSALSHSPRIRCPGQRVKILPSLQYRLIHFDTEDGFSSPDPELQLEDTHSQHSLHSSHTKLGFAEDSPSTTDSGPPGLSISESTSVWMDTTRHDHPGQGLCRGSIRTPETGDLSLSQRLNGDSCENCVSNTSSSVPTPGRSVEPFHTSPAGPEPLSGDSMTPAQFLSASSHQRGGKHRLSLRQFFSAITLSGAGTLGKGRSSSMEHLSCPPKPSCASPSSAHRQRGWMKKAPSLQSLRLQGSPLANLQKASSVQSLPSPKKKHDRSSSYTPGDHPSVPARSGLQQALSVDDVGSPSGGRSVGRVAQAFSDGTLLLELTRPPCGPFGFLISRGKGRPDSGVYVEEISDSSTQKIYAGLLGVGDEILEVNGEKVAGLSLEQVTWLMTRDSTASVRVLRHRQKPN
ncbi:uncharacterized protein KIAA1614-like isoform X1 [Arapaima gigas]